MKAVFVVLFVVVGSAYCRSLPAQPVVEPSAISEPSDIKIESLSGRQIPLIRKARQFGKEKDSQPESVRRVAKF